MAETTVRIPSMAVERVESTPWGNANGVLDHCVAQWSCGAASVVFLSSGRQCKFNTNSVTQCAVAVVL